MNHETLHDRNVAHCRLADFRKTLRMFTGRWKLEILWLLYQRNYLVAELRRAMPNITWPVLTAKLHELEADGLVKRTIHEEITPRVEYEMKEGARQFGPFVCVIMQWARQKAPAQDPNRCQMEQKSGAAMPSD